MKTENIKAHVICCNETIVYVVIGDINSAYTKLNALSAEAQRRAASTHGYSSGYYHSRNDWRVITVDGEVV